MSDRRAVFLDRDGVLNAAVVREGRPYPPNNVREMRMTQDAPECLSRLRGAGFLLIVATNQPDVARGAQSREAVEEINEALCSALPLDAVYVCYHDNRDHCECRKPAPGMLLEAAERFDIDLAESFMIGDRWSDVETGRRAGCRTVFLDFGYEERRPETAPDLIAGSLAEGVDWILNAGKTQGFSARIRERSSMPATEPIS